MTDLEKLKLALQRIVDVDILRCVCSECDYKEECKSGDCNDISPCLRDIAKKALED
jgi:hypothetical protein